MRVLITGANGFIGKNLQSHLLQRKDVSVVNFTRGNDLSELNKMVSDVDFIFHFAGVNRPENPQKFNDDNVELTKNLCDAVISSSTSRARRISVIYTSSIQVSQGGSYARSKREAEELLISNQMTESSSVYIFRLPNVFGKWCRPNYNSVVATFCNNVARELPINITDPSVELSLVYIDDLIKIFIEIMDGVKPSTEADGCVAVKPVYSTTVGGVAKLIQSFYQSRRTLLLGGVGSDFRRALYATYVSYLPEENFLYDLQSNIDERGVFVEMMKTPDCGQFSFFTLNSGLTRGGHYHHSKTEKFLIVSGEGLFRFRNILTGQRYELMVSSLKPQIVQTIPGWAHDITNIGINCLVVMLWANEIFDPVKSDTYDCAI